MFQKNIFKSLCSFDMYQKNNSSCKTTFREKKPDLSTKNKFENFPFMNGIELQLLNIHIYSFNQLWNVILILPTLIYSLNSIKKSSIHT